LTRLRVDAIPVDRAWSQRVKRNYDNPLSTFAIIFNLRPYILYRNMSSALDAGMGDCDFPLTITRQGGC
jgi:hypothetical protein